MKRLIIPALLLSTLGAARLDAQVSANGNASVVVPQVLAIQSVGDLNIDGTGFDFSAGDISSTTGTVDITSRANLIYTLEVTATDIQQAGVADPLGFGLIPSGGGAAVSLNGGATATWNASMPRGATTSTLTFEATANVNLHDPGTYSGQITYTIIGN